MKRGEPLKRRKALDRRAPLTTLRQPAWAKYPSDIREVELVCAVCGTAFTYRAQGGFRRKTCSPGCTSALKRQRMKGHDRKGTANPNHRHGLRAGHRNREAEAGWYAALASTCQHPDCPDPLGGQRGLVLHHVVYRQHVRREHGDEWDPRNSLTLCDSCHTSHHRRGTRVIPLPALPDAAVEFAFELLGPAAYDYLTRRYRGTDARVEALIA